MAASLFSYAPLPLHQTMYPFSNFDGQYPSTAADERAGIHPAYHDDMPRMPPSDRSSAVASPTDVSAPGGAGVHSPGEGKVRLRKACDSCSIRKVKVGSPKDLQLAVPSELYRCEHPGITYADMGCDDLKCDENGPPCKACAALDIPCTFERPSRRRGPPNRHAAAFKRQRLESSTSPHASSPPSPTSAMQTAETLAAFAQQHVLSAESICPLPLLQLLIDDYFKYIHPLIPMPHEPSFREGLRRREDVSNPRFLAMLASMIGVLVASFPRKPRLHLKAQNRENLFPNSLSLVDRCHKIATDARGPGYLDTELTVYDGITSYLLGLTGSYTFNWRQCRLYFGECLNIARLLGLHRAQSRTPSAYGRFPTSANLDSRMHEVNGDLINQEIGRRLFWVLFVGIQSCHQLGTHFGELFFLPATPSDPYPPLPLEVDDEFIFPHSYVPQSAGVISKLVGFNANVRVYSTYHALTTMEMAYGIDTVFDWDRQRRVLEQCLYAARSALDGVPRELMLEPSSWSRAPPPSHLSPGYYPPTSDGANLGPYPRVKTEEPISDPRNLQYEIQKANIYGSQLGTRSYLVEKYWTLHDAAKSGMSRKTGSPGAIAAGLDGYIPPSNDLDMSEQQMANEREYIIKDLLDVLSSISQVNMEPNGASFINKIRQIAATLLDVPPTRKSQLAQRTEAYLATFMNVLMKLEHVSSDGQGREGIAGSEEDEEMELRAWADLRDAQSRFMNAGGFTSQV